MHFLDERLLIKTREFLGACLSSQGMQSERPIIIAYHGDGDGCCAAYFMQRYVRRPPLFYWVSTPDFDFVKAEHYLTKQNPLLMIFLDMPVYNRPEMIERLSTQGKVFIYDHHYPGICDAFQSNDNVFYVNPVIDHEGKAFPTALFGWEILTEKAAFDKEVLFMGLYTETWLQEIPLFEEFGAPSQDCLKEVAKRIHASFLMQDTGTDHYALNFLLKASNGGTIIGKQPQEIREYYILENIHGLIQHEKGWLIRRLSADIRSLVNPKFILKKIDSKMRLSGLIASELRWKHPRLVVGIWQRWKERFICELRRGQECEVNLASLVERVKSEVPLKTGGGHPAAAAFTGEEDHFFEALQRIKIHITEAGHA
ncbi:MAG: hypothetical protein PVG99_07130 [Desulfobacteraceae bacterium]|jgi:hypothetical protein